MYLKVPTHTKWPMSFDGPTYYLLVPPIDFITIQKYHNVISLPSLFYYPRQLQKWDTQFNRDCHIFSYGS